jgi:hypothetical protein
MSPHNDLSTLPFEKKIKLLDEDEKTCTGELIDRLLAERHERQQLSTPTGGKTFMPKGDGWS